MLEKHERIADAVDDRAKAFVGRFELESMALHRIQREWLVREIAELLRVKT